MDGPLVIVRKFGSYRMRNIRKIWQPLEGIVLLTDALSLGCFERRFIYVSYSCYWLEKSIYPKLDLDLTTAESRPDMCYLHIKQPKDKGSGMCYKPLGKTNLPQASTKMLFNPFESPLAPCSIIPDVGGGAVVPAVAR